MKRIMSLFVVLIFAISFVGNVPEAQAAEPSLAQCQAEPSKGTGWGTFWMVYGGLNALSGIAIHSAADDYDYIDGTTALIGGSVLGGALMGLGIGMRHSAKKYNKACSNLLSETNVQPDIGNRQYVVFEW